MTSMQILFRNDRVDYEVLIEGDSTKRFFPTRDEAEFFIASTYFVSDAVRYDGYRVIYHNDMRTVAHVVPAEAKEPMEVLS